MAAAAQHGHRSWHSRPHDALLRYRRPGLGRCCGAAVKILVPDNTGNADVLGAIGAIAAAFGRAPVKSDSEI